MTQATRLTAGPGPRIRPGRLGPRVARRAAIVIAGLLVGCEPAAEDPPTTSHAAPVPVAVEPSHWRRVDGNSQVVVTDGGAVPGLAEAVRHARETAPAARDRWHATPEGGRGGWAVKWAAETLDGGLEHVWVTPVRWSAFRIEGRLASPPVHDLVCGRAGGELVSFPVEELVDWMHTPAAGGPREGGFTTTALEAHFGHAPGDA